jgi:hypothetical protein
VIDTINFSEWTPNAIIECLDSTPTNQTLGKSLMEASGNGYWLEFGVASGRTLNYIVDRANKKTPRPTVVGFDSFEGLPEDWENVWSKGTFRQENIPNVNGANIVVGLFDKTLVPWINSQNTNPVITAVHIDCDLYSSTKYVLSHIAPLLIPGSFIIFDELLNYNGFEKHEWLALYECAIQEKLFNFEWFAHQVFDEPSRREEPWPVAIRIIE